MNDFEDDMDYEELHGIDYDDREPLDMGDDYDEQMMRY